MFHRSCRTHSGRLTLIAGCLVTFTLGSVHAFSVFVLPLESFYSVGRSSVSFVYSLALLSLTIMVFFGHRFYGRCSPPNLTALACIVAGSGLLIAGTSSSLIGVYVHSLCSDIFYSDISKHRMLSADILDIIPKAFNEIIS